MRISHSCVALSILTAALTGAACVTDEVTPDDPVSEPTPPTDPVDDPDDPLHPETLAEASQRVLDQWMRCMTLEDFRASNMVAWGSMQANGGTCDTCHVTGGAGFIASRNEQPFFTTLVSNKYYTLQYFTIDLTLGAERAKVVINTTSLANVGSGAAPHTEHPRFNALTSPGMTALQAFYDRTVARLPSAACTPPLM